MMTMTIMMKMILYYDGNDNNDDNGDGPGHDVKRHLHPRV